MRDSNGIPTFLTDEILEKNPGVEKSFKLSPVLIIWPSYVSSVEILRNGFQRDSEAFLAIDPQNFL